MRTIDKTKKSNIKCEHCKFYIGHPDTCIAVNYNQCTNQDSPKYGMGKVNYWNRCKNFKWR